MIEFIVKQNLDEVMDYVGQMNNEIQSIVASAVDSAREEITSELVSVYQIGADDLVIDFQFNGGDYTLSVDGINPYQLYNNLGIDMEHVFDFVQGKILDKIQSDLNNAGYAYGN